METPQNLWATCSSVLISLVLKDTFFCLNGAAYIIVYGCCLLSCHWVLLRRVCSSSFVLILPYQAFTHLVKNTLEPSLLQARESQLSQPLLVCQMLQSLESTFCPFSGQDLVCRGHVCLALRNPKVVTSITSPKS